MNKLFNIQAQCGNSMCLHFKSNISHWNNTNCGMFEIDPISDKNKSGFSTTDCGTRKMHNKTKTENTNAYREVDIYKKCHRKLKDGHKELYLLFYNSLTEKRVVTRSEMFIIYKEKVGKGSGIVKLFNKDTNQHVLTVKEWDSKKWNTNFNMWFIQALGSLLKKGLLRVVPAINLSECDDIELFELGIQKNEITLIQ